MLDMLNPANSYRMKDVHVILYIIKDIQVEGKFYTSTAFESLCVVLKLTLTPYRLQILNIML